MEIGQHCWKFIYKHFDLSIFLYVTDFIFYIFFTCTEVEKIFLQINPAEVAFINILIAAWEGLSKLNRMSPKYTTVIYPLPQVGYCNHLICSKSPLSSR